MNKPHTHKHNTFFTLSPVLSLCSLSASRTHTHKCTHTPICFLQAEKQALVYKSCTQWRWREQSTLSISGGQRHTSTPTYTHVSAGLLYTKHLLPGIWTLSSSPVSCASVSLDLYLIVSVCLLCADSLNDWNEKRNANGMTARHGSGEKTCIHRRGLVREETGIWEKKSFLSETPLETKLLPDIVQETHQTHWKVIIFRILHYPFTESYSSLVQYSPQCGLVVLV